jgi:glycosyltransferase involved in cell wall biosynthesis
MTDLPFVSVVTPVHNTAEYLSQCIESVLGQTFGNFEYLIVDNCSTDESLRIAQRYAAEDRRMRILTTASLLSQVDNYNFALSQISPRSRYCKMVQADDWIYPECLAEMVRVGESDESVAIVGAYQLAGGRVMCEGLEGATPQRPFTIVSGRDACRLFFLKHRYLFGTPTSVMYRASLVRERVPFFRTSSYHEDSELCFEVLQTARFGFVHKVLTFTRTDNISISTRVQDYDPYLLHEYIIGKLHGRLYLDETEHARHFRTVRRNLYTMLALSLFQRRGDAFWDYHRRGLAMVGDRLSAARIWLLQVPRVFRWLGNPLSFVERNVDRFARRRVR